MPSPSTRTLVILKVQLDTDMSSAGPKSTPTAPKMATIAMPIGSSEATSEPTRVTPG
jgi:hypothetical protein